MNKNCKLIAIITITTCIFIPHNTEAKSIFNKLKSTAGKVVKQFKKVPEKTFSQIKKTPKRIINTPKNVVKGVKTGVKVVKTAVNVGKDTKDLVKTIKPATENSINAVRGLIEKIKATEPELKQNAEALKTALVGIVKNKDIDELGTSIELLLHIVNNLLQIANHTVASFKQIDASVYIMLGKVVKLLSDIPKVKTDGIRNVYNLVGPEGEIIKTAQQVENVLGQVDGEIEELLKMNVGASVKTTLEELTEKAFLEATKIGENLLGVERTEDEPSFEKQPSVNPEYEGEAPASQISQPIVEMPTNVLPTAPEAPVVEELPVASEIPSTQIIPESKIQTVPEVTKPAQTNMPMNMPWNRFAGPMIGGRTGGIY